MISKFWWFLTKRRRQPRANERASKSLALYVISHRSCVFVARQESLKHTPFETRCTYDSLLFARRIFMYENILRIPRKRFSNV